jgi:hypothetical protein
MSIWMAVAWAQDAQERFEDESLVRGAPTWVGGYQPEWIVKYATGGPMDTLTFLQAAQAIEQEREFRKLQDRSLQSGIALAGLGTGLTLLGLIGFEVALVEEDPLLAAVGGGVFLGGIGVYYACSFPFFKHARREQHPAEFLTAEQADGLIEAHNRALRQELGLP